MWKKILSVIALVAVVGTTSTSAMNITPIVRQAKVLSNVSVDFGSFVPADGMVSNITFDLAENADVAVTVDGPTVADLSLAGTAALPLAVEAGEGIEVTFFGRTGNSPDGDVLPQGTYVVTVKAKAFEDETEVATINVRVENSTVNNQNPRALNVRVDQREFDPRDGEATGISFDLSDDAYVSLFVEDTRGNLVRSFENFQGDKSPFRLVQENPILVTWDGKDNDGQFVADGNYMFRFLTRGANGVNSYIEYMTVKTRDGQSVGVIRDIKLDPSRVWNPERENLEVEVELNRTVKRLLVRLERAGVEVVEIADEVRVDENEIIFSTDMYDNNGNTLREGVYTLVVIADSDRVEIPVEVRYEEQNIIEAYLSKTEFDPSKNEVNYLIFKSGVNSRVTVELFKGNQRELVYLDKVDIGKNRLYALEITGIDRDGDELIPEANWRLKVTAENKVENNVYSTEFVSLMVKEDKVSDRKANATNDRVSPVVFDDRERNNVDLSFCVDQNGVKVDLEVFEDFSTSGRAKATLLKKTPLNKGCHTITWEFDKSLDQGVYTYKLVVESDAGRRDTEIGRFSVGSTGEMFTGFVSGGNDIDLVTCPAGYNLSGGVCVKGSVTTPPPTGNTGDCGGYWDTNNLDAETCAAVAWVTKAGIFGGYADGSFGPYNDINRAEALKVIFSATNAPLVPVDGSGAGFIDVNPQAWYMPYIRTAKLDGFIEGYATARGQEVRPDRNITRVEFLKLMLEAAARYQGLFIPASSNAAYYTDVMSGAWYAKYADMAYNYYLMNEYTAGNGKLYLGVNDIVQRREVALALHRMYNNGLIR